MIFCASNEQKPTREAFKAHFPEDGCVVPLVSGDYVIADYDGHTLGVERKKTRDLTDSISDGRLRSELTRLGESFSHPVLLLEGGHGRSEDGMLTLGTFTTGFRYTSVMGMLWYYARRGIIIVETPSLVATLEWLRIMHDKARRCFDD